MDSESTEKKEFGTEASGDHLMEQQTQKKELVFNLEVTPKTPLNQKQKTSLFPPLIRQKNWIPPSPILQHSSPPTLINQKSPPTDNLHPLWEKWLRSPQPRLSWAPLFNPPDLQYPSEQEPLQGEPGKAFGKILRVVQAIKERIQKEEDQEVEAILEETPEAEGTLEEGEIWEETQGTMTGEAIAS